MSNLYPHRCLIVASVSSPAQPGKRARHRRKRREYEGDKYSLDDQIDSGHRVIVEHADVGWYKAHNPLIIAGHSRTYEFLDELTADCPEYAELMRIASSETFSPRAWGWTGAVIRETPNVRSSLARAS